MGGVGSIKDLYFRTARLGNGQFNFRVGNAKHNKAFLKGVVENRDFSEVKKISVYHLREQ